MADVKIIDIDSEQWNMKDQNARDRISAVETKIESMVEAVNSKGLRDIRNRTNADLVSLNLRDESNTGYSIDFDCANGRIIMYKVVNGTTVDTKTIQ